MNETPVAASHEATLAWLDERLDQVLSAPRMWGSLEAVEMQVLLLLETRCFVVSGATPARYVLDRYVRYLRERLPDGGVRPLFQQVGADGYSSLVEHLSAFRMELVEQREKR